MENSYITKEDKLSILTNFYSFYENQKEETISRMEEIASYGKPEKVSMAQEFIENMEANLAVLQELIDSLT